MKSFLLLLILPSLSLAALPATAVINIRPGATAGNLNGGGFNSARSGTDYSLQDAAQLHGTDGTSTASTTFNSVAGTFTDAMKGNYLHLISATGADEVVGWYEIVSVTDANNVVLDRTSGTYTVGDFYVGGAVSLETTGAAGDDDLFEIAVTGNTFAIQSGTYTMGEVVAISVVGGPTSPIIIRGYTTTPGDACAGTSRPLLDCAANGFTLGTAWDVYNVRWSITTSTGFNSGAGSKIINCKGVNPSTTAGRPATTLNSDSVYLNSEFVSYRGNGIVTSTLIGGVINCWIHDCDVGFNTGATGDGIVLQGNIIESCVTAAVRFTGGMTGATLIHGNTLFGSVNTTGIGISLATGCTDIRVMNNNITGFATGVSHADANTIGYDDFNNYQNNDADVNNAANWQKGANDSAVAPSFTSVGQVTGATATTGASNTLTQSGATFQTSGVTAGRDYIYIVSGTGVTAGIYGILSVDSETQLTTDITLAADATADKVFQITTGHNFAVGAALKALAGPGAFQGGYSTSYTDPGAVQRQESGGGQTSSASVK